MNENKMNTLLEILSKDKLTSDDEIRLNDLIDNDKEAKELFELYKKLEASVKSFTHLSTKDIANFLLIEKGVKSFNPSENSLFKKINSHIDKCTSCKEEYNLLAEEYAHLENHLSASIKDETQTEENKNAFLSSFFSKRNNFVKYSFAFTVLIVFVYFSAFLISDLSAPKYLNSASIKSEREFYTTRSRGTDDFQKSLSAFDNDNFVNGIKYLKKDIIDNSKDETIFYSYYILGIAYLQSAESDVLGLFKSFDKTKVSKGIKNLKLSISKNNSGSFENIKFNSYYYLAKGYLMLNDVASAKAYLNKVIKDKGSKMNDAIKLLEELR